MTYAKMLGRRSEILKRTIGDMIAKDNTKGLGMQESSFLRTMIKELHQNEYELQRNS
ncbi:hypothetical protein SAMN02799616_03527 [Paenibacillus sp. UNC499MF]|uniref:hypothetical protein n=1 Tax=Paenibacillus TaxID=44249 RepID=UPI0008A0814F|nr:hypothetical protein [Paenibacillus chitinolyticus]MEC0246013.1 hypothetical protein [Paenibacillus chitinolyticus]SEG56296.1 hypothetical protein SAMN02799616_03527 [Paenibacillus sp. UNC499MF]